MSFGIGPMNLNGYYDDKGAWQRTKMCFAPCERCDCGPPMGVWQRPLVDTTPHPGGSLNTTPSFFAPHIVPPPSPMEFDDKPLAGGYFDRVEAVTKAYDEVVLTRTMQHLRALAEAVVKDATLYGLVVTIECVPLEPLAMGNHKMVVNVRKARGGV